jgi:hypothetical protein
MHQLIQKITYTVPDEPRALVNLVLLQHLQLQIKKESSAI